MIHDILPPARSRFPGPAGGGVYRSVPQTSD
jgi:hypothetical protein